MQAQQTSFLNLLNGQVQYVVPRWQRRYRWGDAEIERLVEDLVTVAIAGEKASHYGGTLLTFPEPGAAAGVVQCIRVVDGQQRLTTISLLLLCIAESLGPEERCEGWSRDDIKNGRLLNPGVKGGKEFKLRLQDGDNEEYQSILRGAGTGIGSVSQAWKKLRKLVGRNELAHLMNGLARLQVVSIGLHDEDPQQIFESINATGRPLSESEKVKNWLLIGYSEVDQEALYREWMELEKLLGAEHTSWLVDEFLRDMLRWKTGKLVGMNQVYEEFRRWAVRTGQTRDRASLCREVVRLSKLYRQISVEATNQQDRRVRDHLNHLRLMGIATHRPLTLRLLNETTNELESKLEINDLVKCLELISTWVTRLWVAGRRMAGMNRAITDLAHAKIQSNELAAILTEKIAKQQDTGVGIPTDSEVMEGVLSRKAYGGSTTSTTLELLYCLNQLHAPAGETIVRSTLTVEHIMPQKLTQEWKEYLGEGGEEIHGKYRDCLANLTLCGDVTNPALGTLPFDKKKKTYSKSPIKITSELAKEDSWNEETLIRRARNLGSEIVASWPWSPTVSEEQYVSSALLKWRIDGSQWKSESLVADMVVNVADELVVSHSENQEKLMGDRLSLDLQQIDKVSVNSRHRLFKKLPRRPDLAINPHSTNYQISIERVREMGRKCGRNVEVDERRLGDPMKFWAYLRQSTGGLRGQKNNWRGAFQATTPDTSTGDQVCVYVGNPDLLWLYIRTSQPLDERKTRRALQYSRLIQEEMGDQRLGTDEGKDIESYAKQGISVTVVKGWNREDEADWNYAAEWVHEQHNRLTEIVHKCDSIV